MSDLITFQKDKVHIKIFNEKSKMANSAANFVKRSLQSAISKNGCANIILATGTSQISFLNALKQKDINWDKITVFHLDEYKGISKQHSASFRKYLKDRIIDVVQPKNIYYINGNAEDLGEEIKSYEKLLKDNPIDIACIGIGENGHIAFNDPPVANFEDSKLVKVVKLDEKCRMQQVNEGWFPSLNDVPTEAITLTIPAIMKSDIISCVVPDKRKAQAVHEMLNKPVSTNCPASILRKHPNATLYLDTESAKYID